MMKNAKRKLMIYVCAMALVAGLWGQSYMAANASGPETMTVIPVILSEDGTFWYDQYGGGISLEDAEVFFSEHPAYWVEIRGYNRDWSILSAWQNQERLGKIAEMNERLADPTVSQKISEDAYVWSVVEELMENPPRLEILCEMDASSRIAGGISIQQFIHATWYRNPDYLIKADTVNYVFWPAMANLADNGIYDVGNIANWSLVKTAGPAYVPGYEATIPGIELADPYYGEPPMPDQH